jgi:hypothetical protein
MTEQVEEFLAANYRFHYTSADGVGELASWSVYYEEYAHPDAPEPIDGSQTWVSSHPSEAEADAEANHLQSQANRLGSPG